MGGSGSLLTPASRGAGVRRLHEDRFALDSSNLRCARFGLTRPPCFGRQPGTVRTTTLSQNVCLTLCRWVVVQVHAQDARGAAVHAFELLVQPLDSPVLRVQMPRWLSSAKMEVRSHSNPTLDTPPTYTLRLRGRWFARCSPRCAPARATRLVPPLSGIPRACAGPGDAVRRIALSRLAALPFPFQRSLAVCASRWA